MMGVIILLLVIIVIEAIIIVDQKVELEFWKEAAKLLKR